MANRLTAEKKLLHMQSTLPDRPQLARSDSLPVTPATEGYSSAERVNAVTANHGRTNADCANLDCANLDCDGADLANAD